MGVKSVFGGGGGAPTDAQYVALATDASLTAERVLTAGAGISLTDAGAGGTVTVAATGGAAGKILQVVNVQFTGLFSTNSLTYVSVADGGATLAATITPSSATSTILIHVCCQLTIASGYAGALRLFDGSATVIGGIRDPANLTQENGVLFQPQFSGWSISAASYSAMGIASPATTSPVTYTMQAVATHASGIVYVNRNTRNGNYVVDSPVPSSITLFEIGA